MFVHCYEPDGRTVNSIAAEKTAAPNLSLGALRRHEDAYETAQREPRPSPGLDANGAILLRTRLPRRQPNQLDRLRPTVSSVRPGELVAQAHKKTYGPDQVSGHLEAHDAPEERDCRIGGGRRRRRRCHCRRVLEGLCDHNVVREHCS